MRWSRSPISETSWQAVSSVQSSQAMLLAHQFSPQGCPDADRFQSAGRSSVLRRRGSVPTLWLPYTQPTLLRNPCSPSIAVPTPRGSDIHRALTQLPFGWQQWPLPGNTWCPATVQGDHNSQRLHGPQQPSGSTFRQPSHDFPDGSRIHQNIRCNRDSQARAKLPSHMLQWRHPSIHDRCKFRRE